MHRNLRRATRELKRRDYFAQQYDPEPTTADDERLARVSAEQEAPRVLHHAHAPVVNIGEPRAPLEDPHALDLQIQMQGYIGGLA